MFGTAALALVVSARAQDLEPEARLAGAIRLYLAGDPVTARQQIQGLLAASDLDPALRRKAMAYLGDILYAEQGPEAARSTFESLLADAPDYAMDPFEHPPEVCAYFEDLRKRSVPIAPPTFPAPAPSEEPWPWTVLLPGGAHYFAEGRPAPGVGFGTLQLVGLGVSVFTYVQLQDDYLQGMLKEDRDEYLRVVTINRAAAAVGWVAYVAPIALETTAWTQRRGRVAVGVGPGSLTVSGTF